MVCCAILSTQACMYAPYKVHILQQDVGLCGLQELIFEQVKDGKLVPNSLLNIVIIIMRLQLKNKF